MMCSHPERLESLSTFGGIFPLMCLHILKREARNPPSQPPPQPESRHVTGIPPVSWEPRSLECRGERWARGGRGRVRSGVGGQEIWGSQKQPGRQKAVPLCPVLSTSDISCRLCAQLQRRGACLLLVTTSESDSLVLWRPWEPLNLWPKQGKGFEIRHL